MPLTREQAHRDGRKTTNLESQLRSQYGSGPGGGGGGGGGSGGGGGGGGSDGGLCVSAALAAGWAFLRGKGWAA